MMIRADSMFLALALFAPLAVGADGETRKYPLPDKSTLQLIVPAGWQDEARPKEGNSPASILFTPREGAPFKVSLTPIGVGQPSPALEAQMRTAVQAAADKVKPQAVEALLMAEEFKGAQGAGYFFSATDAAPKPGEYKYLSEGMLLVGEVVVSFGILTNDGQEAVKEQAFSMLRSAARVK